MQISSTSSLASSTSSICVRCTALLLTFDLAAAAAEGVQGVGGVGVDLATGVGGKDWSSSTAAAASDAKPSASLTDEATDIVRARRTEEEEDSCTPFLFPAGYSTALPSG